MLEVSYDPFLVIASVLVAIMAAFTGLRLTNGIGALPAPRRKIRIAQSAIALGGGIWSMHFVGMLAVSLPVAISYDALPTLGSVLIAILVVGIGLIALHFGVRTQTRILLAGVLTGLGIVSMHYLGMSAIRGRCILVYDTTGVFLATGIAIVASIFALELAYRRRKLAMTAAGAVVLGLAISAMHYVAMLFTVFMPANQGLVAVRSVMMPDTLAIVVALSAFLFCGLFLLTAIPTRDDMTALATPSGDPVTMIDGRQEPSGTSPRPLALSQGFDGPARDRARLAIDRKRIPYERDNAIRFLDSDEISAVRADGHYTRIMNRDDEFFCPWSISKVERSIETPPFIRTHRSYLVNLGHVAGFKREGDKAYCLLGPDGETKIPVSRAKLTDVQEALGLS